MQRWNIFFSVVLLLGCDGGGNGGQDTSLDEVDDTSDVSGDTPGDPAGDTEEDGSDAVESGCTSDGDCDDGDPCTSDTCDPESGDCSSDPLDADGDGYPAMVSGTVDCGGTDCDDGDADVYPDSDTRICDADGDCNGELDADNDADGYDGEVCGGDDCDDDEPLRNPGAAPGCGTDSSDPMSDLDCNGNVDGDNDDDGHDAPCIVGGTDCDDSRPDVHLGADEVCFDGVDQDCDTIVDGIQAEPGDVLLSTVTADHRTPVLVHNGSDQGGLYYRGSGSSGVPRLWFTRFLSDGTRVISDLGVTGTNNAADSPDMVWTGSEYGVIWTDSAANRDLYFVRLSADGAVTGSVERITNAMGWAQHPSLVWSGSEYALAWDDQRGTALDIYFARISADGTKVGTDIPVTENTEESTLPSMVWTGSEYVVAYEETFAAGSDIFVERVSPTGAPVAARQRVFPASALSSEPSLAWSGTELGIAWQDYLMGNWDLAFARLEPTGVMVGSQVWIATSSNSSTSPSLVWTGSEYGLTFEDDSVDNLELWFLRIAADGTRIDDPTHRITSASWESRDPSLSWTGSEYGVLFIDMRSMNNDLYFKAVTFCE